MYHGTLAGKGPWQALVTFQQLVILAEPDGTVDRTAEALSRLTTIPLEIILIGIAALEQPDPESRSPDEQGRRIVRLSENRSWGWRVVNYEKYSLIRSAADRREYHAGYYLKRKAKKNGDSTDIQQLSTIQHLSTVSTDRDRDRDRDREIPLVPSPDGILDVSLPADDVEMPPERPVSGFETAWAVLPKRGGGNPKKRALEAYKARVKEGVDPVDLLAGAQRYANFIRAGGKEGTEYVMQGATFFGPKNRAWEEEWSAPKRGRPDAVDRGVNYGGGKS